MIEGGSPIHINAKEGEIAPIVLMPGDPLRAKYIADNFLNNVKEVCNLRNMLGFTGIYKGVKVSVVGSGMGMPSMGIYSWELFKYYNVQKIIRIGTCGVVSPEVKIPELILATSAYSESNFAYTYNECNERIMYPSKELNDKLISSANEQGIKMHIGDITTMDVFGPYANHDNLLKRLPKDLNIIGEEMEAFALFFIAREFKRQAACVLSAVDSPFSDIILSSEERQTGLNDMIKTALEAIIK